MEDGKSIVSIILCSLSQGYRQNTLFAYCFEKLYQLNSDYIIPVNLPEYRFVCSVFSLIHSELNNA